MHFPVNLVMSYFKINLNSSCGCKNVGPNQLTKASESVPFSKEGIVLKKLCTLCN